MSSRTKNRQKPTERDLGLWRQINEDLLDWLYSGLTGRFQIAGHRLLDLWAKEYVNSIVLEVGCGHGHHLRYGENKYETYVGVDIEHKFLRNLRDRFPGTPLINSDIYAIPLRDNSVDCVLSVYCFEHLRKLPSCLAEIRRVLKQSGYLLIGLPAEGGLLYRVGRNLTSKPYMKRKYGIDYDTIVQWEHWNTYREVVEMVQEQFEIVEQKFIPFSFLPLVDANVIACLKTKPILERHL
jgi:ubiquinone/menaquinone biosynthesis C-methylase UbiE